jgi:hypothetical protein
MSDPNAADNGTKVALAELLAELPDHLRNEADAAVADARGADDLVGRLADLRERRGAGGGMNEAVSDASSVADLRAELDAAGESDGADDESAANDDGGISGRVRSTLDSVRDRVTGDDAESDTDADADTDFPALAGIERSGQLPADARSTSVPAPDRDVSLLSVSGSGSRNVVRAARERADAGAIELKRTVRDADPKQAALWGLATGVTVATPAIAASYSTAALLSGAVLGGGAVGAYDSSHDDTVFDDVDPMLMAQRANAGASTGAGARNINGEATGTMLGAAAYLAEELTPEAYAHWVTEVDAESVLRGAEMGADRATASDDFEGARSGAALGGGLGLLYGLAADDHGDGDADSLRTLLDDDLWDEYAGRLGGDESAAARE